MLSMAAFNCYVFSITSGKNSLLGGTMEFAADQRIRAALSIEKQWNLCGVRKWRIGVTPQLVPPTPPACRRPGAPISRTGKPNFKRGMRDKGPTR
jgi:hypothetical protein